MPYIRDAFRVPPGIGSYTRSRMVIQCRMALSMWSALDTLLTNMYDRSLYDEGWKRMLLTIMHDGRKAHWLLDVNLPKQTTGAKTLLNYYLELVQWVDTAILFLEYHEYSEDDDGG